VHLAKAAVVMSPTEWPRISTDNPFMWVRGEVVLLRFSVTIARSVLQ
jgi:hypothetical protein